jgi:DNA-binding MarR family transcriptional regulator
MRKPSKARPNPSDAPLEFLRLLWRIEHGLQRVSKRMEITHGVTGPQRLILRLVRERPDLTARELADLLFLHASTVTGILQRLEKKGLVVRERDPRDNRRVMLRVPAGASVVIDRSEGTIEAAIRGALSSVARARTKDAQLVLAEIARALGADAKRR